MEGEMAHGITEVVKGALFPPLWLFNCVRLWVLYQLDIFLSFLKWIDCIGYISSMWFLFVAYIFKLQGQRFFKFQRHQVCENSGTMDLNDFSVVRACILELKILILNPQSTICQLYLIQSEIAQPSELKGLPFLQNWTRCCQIGASGNICSVNLNSYSVYLSAIYFFLK